MTVLFQLMKRLQRWGEQARQRADRLATLNEVGRAVSTLRDLDDVLETIYQQVKHSLPLDCFFVGLYDAAMQQISFPIMYDDGQRWDESAPRALLESSFSSQVIRSGQPLLASQSPQQMAGQPVPPNLIGDKTRFSASLMFAPLPAGDRMIGVISAQSYAPNVYDEDDLDLLVGIAYQAASAIQNARLYAAAQQELAERQRVEAQLRQSEERYRLISEVSSDYMFSTKLDARGELRLNWVAGAFETITGYSFEQYLARGGWLAALHPDDVEQDARDMAQLHANRRVITEVRTITKDGAVRWVRVYAHPVWNGPERRLEGIYGAVQDITERKRLENQLRQLAEQANRRAGQLAMLNEIGTAVLALTDLPTVFETIYRQTRKYLSADLFFVGLYDLRNNLLFFPLMYDEGRLWNQSPSPLTAESFSWRAIESRQPLLVDQWRSETSSGQTIVGDAARLTASLMFAPMLAGEEVIGILSVQSYQTSAYSEDDLALLAGMANQTAIAIQNARLYSAAQQELAERERAQAERENLIAELETKNAELERFTYTVSHDLKSPLITIRGFLGYLERDVASGDRDRFNVDLSRIAAAADRMQRLLNELLELSRIGRLINPSVTTPLEPIVREALEATEGRWRARGIHIEVAPDLPEVYGDRARLVEVLQNLIDNACKFMGEQPEPHLTIEPRGTEAGGRPIICVRDNGIGIDPQYHERVFGLFDKLDAHSDGTGVGLALVKRIVEVHGGRIWVESQAGQGAAFCFTLPAPPRSA